MNRRIEIRAAPLFRRLGKIVSDEVRLNKNTRRIYRRGHLFDFYDVRLMAVQCSVGWGLVCSTVARKS